jgi:hypothetical protein
MVSILNDVKVPAPAELRAEILAILTITPQSAKSLLGNLSTSRNKTTIATQQRLSRFLGQMSEGGLIKAVKPTGGPNIWSVTQSAR